MKKAILYGASGLVGSHLLDFLLHNPDYEQVTIVVRKSLNINHPKLKILIGEYQSLHLLKDDIEADEVFIALGTTKNKTPDQKAYYQVDHDYPVLATKMAKEQGAKSVFIVTAVGANANSSVFYVRTKGEVERDIIALDLDHTHIFRPSMILGDRKENRRLERIIAKAWPVISTLLKGKLSIYRGIEAREIAQAMNNATKHQKGKVAIYHWKEMKDLL